MQNAAAVAAVSRQCELGEVAALVEQQAVLDEVQVMTSAAGVEVADASVVDTAEDH